MPDIEEEQRHFNSFLKLLLPAGNYRIVKSESPDFILESQRKTIGVEHTRLFVGQEQSLAAIEAAIHKKAAKVKRYLNQCDEVWLLLVCNDVEPLTDTPFPGCLPILPSNGGFQRIYYLDYGRRYLEELCVGPKTVVGDHPAGEPHA